MKFLPIFQDKCGKILKDTVIQSLILVFSIFVSVSLAQAQSGAPEPEFRKGELIVEVSPGSSIDIINARYGTTTIQQIYGTNLYRLRTPNGKKENKWRKRLAKDADLLSVALNPVVLNPVTSFARSQMDFPDGHPTPAQSPAAYNTQQLITQLQLADVKLRSTGKGIVVAIVDTGVDGSHRDLATHLWSDTRQRAEVPGNGIDDDNDGLIDDVNGWNFVNNNGDFTEHATATPQTSVAGHGTFIAGLILLVAPDAKLMPVRAFDADGLSDAFTVASAIKYAADHGAQIINLSFGSVEESEIIREAVIYARQRGALLIAATGNENDNLDNRPRFPAGWKDDTISVTATDADDKKATFANFGAGVTVAAPGVRLFSAYPGVNGGDYAMWSGTSFAAPLVSAEAALILQLGTSITTVRGLIENTAVPIDANNQSFAGKLGKGRISPLNALRQFDTPATNHKEITLNATGVEPAARGKAEITVTATRQEVEIEANNIVPRGRYKVIVDGTVIVDANGAGTVANSKAIADDFGSLKIELSSPQDSDHLPIPATLLPVTAILHVEIRDAQSRIVLQNDFQAPGGGGSGGGQVFEKETNLTATGVIPQAKGKARAEIESEGEQLRVEGDNLVSGAAYQVFADGIAIGTATAQSGYFRLELSGGALPAAIRPVTNIRHIEVRNTTGQVVLQGDFQASDDSGGGSGGGGGGGTESSFTAAIETLPASGLIGDWRVGGKTVHVTAATTINQEHGAVAIGVTVEVKGTTQSDGSINATSIETKTASGGGGGGGGDTGTETEFTAAIESMPASGYIGDWRIGGRTVHVSSTTELDQSDGAFAVGVTVEVRGIIQSDSSINASRIRSH